MVTQKWCEHLDKASKYTILTYVFDSKEINLRVQSWVCPECGVHGAETEIIPEDARKVPPEASRKTA